MSGTRYEASASGSYGFEECEAYAIQDSRWNKRRAAHWSEKAFPDICQTFSGNRRGLTGTFIVS